eukprot:CAMPEP_0184685574 /NCGR_PEP_ID=MMETSP0312-20130426/19474_1 /TAXON_ID=31354 /ORGANISM="Compsopogon coeruleus, Strain SAG 36.94" /LENGTH=433 /DNA_ID=CAMNT_0027139795 /DNA_START=192 /DNA_END=1490 /DNA_ORIENTATION=+
MVDRRRSFFLLTLVWGVILVSLGHTTDVFVPSQLLIRMQKNLLQSQSLIQVVDYDQLSLDQASVEERLMIGVFCSLCHVKISQGMDVAMLNGLGEIYVYNEFDSIQGRRVFRNLSVIVEGVSQTTFTNFSTGMTLALTVEDLQDSPSVSAQFFSVQTEGDNSSVTPIHIPSSLFQESVTVTQMADTCIMKGNNTRDNRAILSLTSTSRPVQVQVTGSKNEVTVLPYASLPVITDLLNLYLSSSVIALQFVSLALLLVDLESVRHLKSQKAVPSYVYFNINLVWVAAIIQGSFSIYAFSQVQQNLDSTWVGCGTWTMIEVNTGYIGRYRCQIISLTETTAWYGYLLYVVPSVIMAIISGITLFAQWRRHKFGLERGLRRGPNLRRFSSARPPSIYDLERLEKEYIEGEESGEERVEERKCVDSNDEKGPDQIVW